MTTTAFLLLFALIGIVLTLLLQIILLRRPSGGGDPSLAPSLQALQQALYRTEQVTLGEIGRSRQEHGSLLATFRSEMNQTLWDASASITKAVNELGTAQGNQLVNVINQTGALIQATEKKLDVQRATIDERLQTIRAEGSVNAMQLREEVAGAIKGLNDSVLQRMDTLRQSVEDRLKAVQEDNTKQLEKMRHTVDEKLQSTLEKRLGESFKQVSERLEAVSLGLGEMKTLATGVGDLKKVLTNVKTRGTWGEVQLGALLEQVLTQEQYAQNVAVTGTSERVEFAIRLPGRGDDKSEPLWLPIDAKFPMEDYQRLVEAQEQADPDAAEAAGKQLEMRIKGCATTIREKYVSPPKTTDFAILYLPTEGLFAETIRRPGLVEFLQRERVVLAGPTTLWSILTSLQMGFQSLAIEKRSSEVWTLLGAVRTEWATYENILGKVQKKLQEASKTIDETQVRTRVIGRKLRTVQALSDGQASEALGLEYGELFETAEEAG